ITPAQSYLLGRAFGTLTGFSSGVELELQSKRDMLVWCLCFVGLGTCSWIFNALFFAGWALFGELQAQAARERLFKALISRELEWFDQNKEGTSTMVGKSQGRVSLNRCSRISVLICRSFITDLQEATAQ